MQIPVILENILIVLGTAATTWFFSREQQKATVQASELTNVEKAISIWRELATDLGLKVDDLSKRCESLSNEIDLLRKENKSLKTELQKAIETYHPSH